jgi:hypothetical protein
VTLVELLVAAALAALLLTLLGAAIATGGRAAGRMGEAGAEAQRRALAWALLRGEVELAGRGLADGTAGLRIDLDPAAAGGDRIGVRYRAAAYRAEPVAVDAWFFAAQDGGGRPNLYRLPDEGVRQPWLVGVTGLHLLGGRRADGAPLARAQLVAGAAPAALHVEIRFEDAAPERGWAWLGRAGALGEVAP